MISPTSRRPEDGPGGTTGASRACLASGSGGTSTADSALADQALADQALADLALAEEDAAEGGRAEGDVTEGSRAEGGGTEADGTEADLAALAAFLSLFRARQRRSFAGSCRRFMAA